MNYLNNPANGVIGGIGIPPWGNAGSGEERAAVQRLVLFETQSVTTSNSESGGGFSLSSEKK